MINVLCAIPEKSMMDRHEPIRRQLSAIPTNDSQGRHEQLVIDPIGENVHDVVDVLAGQTMVGGKGQSAVHHPIGVGKAAIRYTAFDLRESWLTKNIATKYHSGRNAALKEELLHNVPVYPFRQLEGVVHPRSVQSFRDTRTNHLVTT
jgi:hypothetical protein